MKPGKKIVLFSDGTGNSSAKAEKTNVWRMFEALDQRSAAQIAKYDDGVGTSSNKYLAGLGGAFGWGLKRNVVDLYKFVCRNYVHGDEIYAFGFSRGSFTIRVLVGLIGSEGLLQCDTEEELDRYAAAAYRHYRKKRYTRGTPLIWLGRLATTVAFALRDAVMGHDRYDPTRNIQHPPIRFLGLWDTVAAYEMPIDEIKRAIDKWIMPLDFCDMSLSEDVEMARHALSLDDARRTFHPMVWDEAAEVRLAKRRSERKGRLQQVWFAGVHSNVGGGYPEDRLSYVSLEWMMGEAQKAELVLDPAMVQSVGRQASPYARLYDSRAGFGVFYRYAPRRVPIFDVDGMRLLPLVHRSVILRMAYGSDHYAPISLPYDFRVVGLAGGTADVIASPVKKPAAAAVPQEA